MSNLAELLKQGVCLSAAGVYDALTARIAEHAGFPIAFLSGSAMGYSQLGRPDIGLLSLGEVAEITGRICERVRIPVVVDVDSGFGNAFHVARMVRMLERRGAAAVQMEDQAEVKPADQPTSRPLIPTGVMVDKLRAAVDAREAGVLLSARTDAIYSEGLVAALDRMEFYLEAGADLLFVEGLQNSEQVEAAAQRFAGRAPLVINLHGIEGRPLAAADVLTRQGFGIRLFPGLLIRAMAAAGATAAAQVLGPGPTTETDLAAILELETFLGAGGASGR
ncbi:MAG: isocitrate lyase/PEP mutase family protein [Pseudomonadota bacterium]